MGVVGDGTVVAPFANAAMRLLREDWKGKFGSKMLAEELYPILQTGIPQPDQNFQNFITVYAGEDNKLALLIDKYGNPAYTIDSQNGLKKVESPGYPPPKLKPRIVWAAKSINAGDSIGGSELDAVAVDPETGATIAGAYVYDPVSGTSFPTAGTATLYVNFTPTDGVKYRKAMGSTVLTIKGSAAKTIPDINWSAPADIVVGTALSGTQLNATATDPVTFASVPGVFTYTPPSGTVLSAGAGQNLSVHFVPTDTVTYDVADNGTSINVWHLGATLRVRVDEDGTGQNEHKDVAFYFASPSAGDTVVVTSLDAKTYTVDFTLDYDIGTGTFTTTLNMTPSSGSIDSGTNPAIVTQNLVGVEGLSGLGGGAGWHVSPALPGGVNITSAPDFVSWIDS